MMVLWVLPLVAAASGFLSVIADASSIPWPVGPYALPMSKHGCPGSEILGWRRGYINMTFTRSRSLYPQCQGAPESEVLETTLEITNNTWSVSDRQFNLYDEYSDIMGPFSDMNLQLNFCYKTKLETQSEEDNGTWPEGHYSIYGGGNGCLSGFNSSRMVMCLPPILTWNYDGHLPYFDLVPGTEDQETRLELLTCTRDNEPETNSSSLQSAGAFMLLKNKECPPYMADVTYPYGVYDETGEEVTFCLKQPDRQQQHGCNAMAEGQHSIQVYMAEFKPQPQCSAMDNDSPCAPDDWMVLDVGRTATVAEIYIEGVNAYLDSTIFDTSRPVKISVSNEKWSFYNNGGLDCHVGDIESQRNGQVVFNIHYFCQRAHTGRYITLHFLQDTTNPWQPRSMLANINYKSMDIHVRGCHTMDSSQGGQEALGMLSGYILDYQITASSSLSSETHPALARPHTSGWCADRHDDTPYIQIDVLSPTAIDGITINALVTTMDNTNRNMFTRDRSFYSFKVMHATDMADFQQYGNRSFQLDLARAFDEPQTFPFMRGVVARWIRIYPDVRGHPRTPCLKMELLGHLKPGMHSLNCEAASTKEIFHSVSALTTSSPTVYTNYTIDMCKAECLTNQSSCVAMEHSIDQQMCHIYMNESPQQLLSIRNKSEGFDYMASVNCITESPVSSSSMIPLTSGSQLITSPGHPWSLPTSQSTVYYWQIAYLHWKLVFAHIALKQTQDVFTLSGCSERIDIDYVYEHVTDVHNGLRLQISGVSYKQKARITYTTCPSMGPNEMYTGFRAYVIRQDYWQTMYGIQYLYSCSTTTCPDFTWLLAQESPRYVSSELMTNSFMGYAIPEGPHGFSQAFFAIGPEHHQGIILTFVEFDVSCHAGGYVTFAPVGHFIFSYCNTNRPFEDIHLNTLSLVIQARTHVLPQNAMVEGFTLRYRIVEAQANRTTISREFPINKPQVYLSGGRSANEGTIHLLHDGEYGSICDDQFGMEEATVICHMLGYNGALAVYGVSHYGKATGPILLDELVCTGTENNISECSNPGWGIHDCDHQEDAGVMCTVSNHEKVYLSGGRTANEGTINVLYNGNYGAICGQGFGQTEGKVVCRMLGYYGNVDVFHKTYFGKVLGPIWLKNVKCNGSETDIFDCEHAPIGSGYCDDDAHGSDAGIICSNSSIVWSCSEEINKCVHKTGIHHGYSWQQAHDDCTAHNSTLVTVSFDDNGLWLDTAKNESEIRVSALQHYRVVSGRYKVMPRNAEELDFIKSYFVDLFMRNYEDIFGFIHIGLVRTLDSAGRLREKWINGKHVSFTAWEPYQPLDVMFKTCTKMNNTQFNFNRQQAIWSSEPCDTPTPATITVLCERPYVLETPMDDIEGRLYTNIAEEGPMSVEASSMFKCEDNEYVSILAVCNGIAECLDQSDERDCRQDDGSCVDDQFQCESGECIHISLVCDYIVDCRDASDEYCKYECAPGEFVCSSGQCIAAYMRCDAQPDCMDGGDEVACESCNSTTAFRCSDSTCISKRLVCDSNYDCQDQTDEECQDFVYKTCDDVLNSGYMDTGTYITVDAQYMECDFTDYKSQGMVSMKYLNIDWMMVIPDKEYWTNSHVFFTAAALDNYTCHQDFTPTMRSLDAEIASIEGTLPIEFEPAIVTAIPIPYIFAYQVATLTSHPYIGVKKLINNDKLMVYIHKPFDFAKYKIPMGPIICNKIHKDIGVDGRVFSCGPQLKPMPYHKVCTYELDQEGRPTGCRNLAHLQNCENVECAENYVKCAASYCIPAAYVCNGRVDCPNGHDELNCLCDSEEGMVVIGTYSVDSRHFEQAYALANGFVSSHRSVYIVHVTVVGDSETSKAVYTIKQLRHPSDYVPVLATNTKDDISMLLDNNNGLNTGINDNTGGGNRGNNTSNEDDNGGKNQGSTDGNNVDGDGNSKPNRTRSFGFISLFTSEEDIYTERVLYDDLANVRDIHEQSFNYRMTVNDEMTQPSSTKAVHVEVQNETVLFLDVAVNSMGVLASVGPQLMSSICKGRTDPYCSHGYVCLYSHICIPTRQLCDGHAHCPHADDERLCDFQCPENCTCNGLTVSCRNTNFTWEDMAVFSGNIKSLDIGNNSGIYGTAIRIQKLFSVLSILNVSNSGISALYPGDMKLIPNLIVLDVSNNNIAQLHRDTFTHLKMLKLLYLEGNKHLKTLHPGAFNGLQHISELSLKHCGITTLKPFTFFGLTITSLDLSHNDIASIEDLSFAGLNTTLLDLTNNPAKSYSQHVFLDIVDLTHLTTSSYKFCCFRPASVGAENCLPAADEFSSCDDLIRNSALQALLWIIGLCAIIGNIASIVFRVVYDRARLRIAYGIFVTNLAIADLLMGQYLLIVAVADTIFRKRYIEMDEMWRSSWWCNFCGVISTISSEASVLIMCLITLDRIFVIKFPYGQVKFTPNSAKAAVMLCWFSVALISVFPLLLESYFEGRFYTSRAVCVALPLTRDRPPGWGYSVVIFIAFNLMAFVLIAFGQCQIYNMMVHKTSQIKKKRDAARARDLRVARNLLLIVTTDFLCWFPIGCMGVMAMAGIAIPGAVYAWTVVLVLPINSALNPVMYTFSVMVNKQALQPSVDEQERTDSSFEHTEHIVSVFKQWSVDTRRIKDLQPLTNTLQHHTMTTQETCHVAVWLARYLVAIHDMNLVAGNIDTDDVLIKYNKKGIMDNGSAVRMKSVPIEGATAKKRAQNMNQLGLLLQRLLQ